MDFTPKGKATIATIAHHLEMARAAFETLSDEESRQCLDMHGEGASLNHCIRWGAQASEEMLEALSQDSQDADLPGPAPHS